MYFVKAKVAFKGISCIFTLIIRSLTVESKIEVDQYDKKKFLMEISEC